VGSLSSEMGEITRMEQTKFSRGDGAATTRASGETGSFTEYVESQAGRMECCGWAEEATNLRRWVRELRSNGVEAGYMVQESLLPRG